MRRPHPPLDAAEAHEAHAARLAWWAAFVTTVILALGLSLVHTAEAASAPVPHLTLAAPFEPEAEEEDEGEEEEFEAEECEFEEFEAEDEAAEEEAEFEEFGCEEDDEGEETPPQCRVEEADAAVSADLVHNRLHLALRYSAVRYSAVELKYFLRGSRGPLTLPSEHPRFGRSGVFRAAEKLTEAQARKVAAAKSFTIQLRPAGAPGYCREYLDQSLSVRRAGHGGPMWIDTESTFRHARHA